MNIYPFSAWWVNPQNDQQMHSLPYDAITTQEVTNTIKKYPFHFLSVIRPDCSPSIATPKEEIEYAVSSWANLRSQGMYKKAPVSSLFSYQIRGPHSNQVGLLAGLNISDYHQGTILKHEQTTPEKVYQRYQLMMGLKGSPEPVLLCFKDLNGITSILKKDLQKPIHTLTDEEGYHHSIHRISQPHKVIDAFKQIPALYIADGHHRCESTYQAARSLNFLTKPILFPAVLFASDQLTSLAYNRIVHKINLYEWQTLCQKMNPKKICHPTPHQKGGCHLYYHSSWWHIFLPYPRNVRNTTIEHLDTYILQKNIFDSIFNIKDPRTNTRIQFVGGSHSLTKMKKVVEHTSGSMAFSLFPTSIESLIQVSDEGSIMPPKSTWIHPKLRSGIFFYEWSS